MTAEWVGQDEIEDRADSARRALVFTAGVGALVAYVFLDRKFGSGSRDRETWLLLTILYGVGYLVAGVLWVRWFHLVALRVESVGRARFQGGWWFWAWVIPGAAIVLPKMMINDLWAASERRGEPVTPQPWIVHAWWAGWVAMGVVGLLDLDDWPLGPGGLAALTFLLHPVVALLAAGAIRPLTDRARFVHRDPAVDYAGAR